MLMMTKLQIFTWEKLVYIIIYNFPPINYYIFHAQDMLTSGFYTERKSDHGPLKVTTEFTWGGKAGGLGRSEVTRDHRYGVEGTLRVELNKTKKQKTVPLYSWGDRTCQVSAPDACIWTCEGRGLEWGRAGPSRAYLRVSHVLCCTIDAHYFK